jgi:hypothetical protein
MADRTRPPHEDTGAVRDELRRALLRLFGHLTPATGPSDEQMRAMIDALSPKARAWLSTRDARALVEQECEELVARGLFTKRWNGATWVYRVASGAAE